MNESAITLTGYSSGGQTISSEGSFGINCWYQWPYYTPPGNINVFYPYPFTVAPVAQRCVWCQGYHTDKCPHLKSVTYREDGKVEHIEFFE